MSKPAPKIGRKLSARTERKRKKAQAGLEVGPDGVDIGRDPRRMAPAELRALGHRAAPLLQTLRRRCVDCCGGKTDEVRRCTAVACPLWPYRMGTDPWEAGGARSPSHRHAVQAPQVPVAAVGEASEPAERAAAGPDGSAAKQRSPDRRSAAPRLPLFDDVGAT